MKKYIVEYSEGIATRISIKTKVKGYTIGILEPFFPNDDELLSWNLKKQNKWIRNNNKLLENICNFLNKSSL